MSCGCGSVNKNDGKNVVDLVRSKGKDSFPLRTPHDIECVNCNETFTMTTHVDKCASGKMVYEVSAYSSHDKNNILAAEVNY